MSQAPQVSTERRLTRRAIILLAVAEMVVVGAISAPLLVVIVPQWLGVETFCLLSETTRAADVFATVFLIALILTGLGVVACVVLRTERCRRVWWLIPPGSIAVLIAAEWIVALMIGQQPCHGGVGIF